MTRDRMTAVWRQGNPCRAFLIITGRCHPAHETAKVKLRIKIHIQSKANITLLAMPGKFHYLKQFIESENCGVIWLGRDPKILEWELLPRARTPSPRAGWSKPPHSGLNIQFIYWISDNKLNIAWWSLWIPSNSWFSVIPWYSSGFSHFQFFPLPMIFVWRDSEPAALSSNYKNLNYFPSMDLPHCFANSADKTFTVS